MKDTFLMDVDLPAITDLSHIMLSPDNEIPSLAMTLPDCRKAMSPTTTSCENVGTPPLGLFVYGIGLGVRVVGIRRGREKCGSVLRISPIYTNAKCLPYGAEKKLGFDGV